MTVCPSGAPLCWAWTPSQLACLGRLPAGARLQPVILLNIRCTYALLLTCWRYIASCHVACEYSLSIHLLPLRIQHGCNKLVCASSATTLQLEAQLVQTHKLHTGGPQRNKAIRSDVCCSRGAWFTPPPLFSILLRPSLSTPLPSTANVISSTVTPLLSMIRTWSTARRVLVQLVEQGHRAQPIARDVVKG